MKLGELRFDANGAVRLFTSTLFIPQGDGLYDMLRKPQKGKVAALRSANGVDSILVPAGGHIRVRCPQCRTITDLSKLTTRRQRA